MRVLLKGGVASLTLAIVAAPLSAAEWSTGASVKTAATYTDNVCLSTDNKQDQWVATVTPSGSVRADGNRANLNVSASAEANSLTNSELKSQDCGGQYGDREQFSPRLSGSADAILIENWLFIDANTSISQNEVSPFVSGGNDSLNRTGNTNTTYSYSVSPYISRRFKDFAILDLRYTWDDQYNSTDVVGDSSQERVNASFGSVPGVSKLSWGLQGDYSKVKYSDRPGRDTNQDNRDSELKSAQFNLGYQLNRFWQLNGFYGDEWNDFVSSRDDIDGTYWDAGLRWTPNARTTVEVGNGHRFYGDSPRFAINYSHKRSALRADYARTVTYSRDIRTLDDTPPFDPDLGQPPGLNPGETSLTDSPILDERFTLGYTYRGLRSRFGLSAFQSDQTSLGDSLFENFNETSFQGISATVSRDLARQMSVSAGANWNEQKPKNNIGTGLLAKSETWTGTLGLSKQLGQKTSMGVDYQYTDRSSDSDFNNYTENRITVNLTVNF
jgi:hypothetical protein